MCVKLNESFCANKTNDFFFCLYLTQLEQETRNLERQKQELREAYDRLAMRQDEKRQCKNFFFIDVIIIFLLEKRIVHKKNY